jgi:hypothetical protein
MANTKVTGDLIAGGTITTFNLADGSVTAAKLNSITTDSISEGTNLFYTDARVGTYLSGNGYDTATNIIATITDSAPTTLDTLNELAAALGDDPNFATTVTNSIATKLPLAGGTISGNLTVSGSLTGTLATAAQPNITSVGTLSSLAVSGDVSIADKIVHTGDTNTAIRFPAADTVTVETNGVERMRIDSSGKVGIKNSNPSAFNSLGATSVLVVGDGGGDSNITVYGDSAGYSSVAFADSDTSSSVAQYAGLIQYYHINDSMAFYANSTERMRIDSLGRVSVNHTNTPKANLDVAADSNAVHLALRGRSSDNIAQGEFWSYDGSTRYGVFGGTPSYSYFGSINNTYTFFLTNGAERMRIDSSGNVGIGQIPDRELNVTKLTDNCIIAIKSGSSRLAGIVLGDGDDDDRGSILYNNTTDHLQFATANTERMRILSNGRTKIGTNPSGNDRGYAFQVEANDASFAMEVRQNNGNPSWVPLSITHEATSGTRFLLSFIVSGSGVGSITSNGSSTAYNTTSDHRLKENVVPIEAALGRVSDLKPSRFNFIADPETTVDGFIAHQVQDIVPEAIFGNKDEIDDKGNPVYQGIDQSKLVPLLTAAIQELKEIVDNQQQQINDLKAQITK